MSTKADHRKAKDLRVLVGVPSQGTWLAHFGMSLLNLNGYMMQAPVPGFGGMESRVANIRTSILSNSRLDCVKAAQKAEADYLLFLDSDQTFPPDAFHQLVSHRKKVVAANVATKSLPAQPTARNLEGTKQVPVFTDQMSTGLEEVWRIGTGVMLIDMRVFREIGLNVWGMPWIEELQKYQGEDWTFCEACEKAQIPLYIDHDLSKRVGHVGHFEYTHEVVGNVIED
jgi:hypothetical protein